MHADVALHLVEVERRSPDTLGSECHLLPSHRLDNCRTGE